MILADQPDCFPDNILVAVSSKDDGTMLDKAMGVHDGSIVSNRTRLCAANGVDYGDTVYQRIIYDDTQTYVHIADVDAHSTTKYVSEIAADAIFTKLPGVAIMLPVADCAATVIYDPLRNTLAVAHLGRHSSYAKLATKLVAHFVADGSRAEDLIIWMCPHAGKNSYRLDWFDRQDDLDWKGYYDERPDGFYLDLAGFNRGLLQGAGVALSHINVSAVDTMMSDDYFSHRSGDHAGRIAVIAMIRA